MDYPYFTAAPQPYQFLGLPPTPAHTGSANSDDFSNSPVRDLFHTVTYNNSSLTPRQDAFEQFQNFDTFNHYNANGIPTPKPPTPLSQPKPSISSTTNHNGFDANMDMSEEAMRRGSNSDDDDNMTPAQSRRKAQNRAASVRLP
jgi:AP-1-like factor